MTDRPLPEEHEGLLRTALHLKAGEALPEVVVRTYWDAERTARRMGARLDSTALVMICLLANRAAPEPPASFLDGPPPKHGDRVLAKFRDKWRWGHFRAVKGRSVIVLVDDDPAVEDREFKPTDVRRPSREELSLIGEV